MRFSKRQVEQLQRATDLFQKDFAKTRSLKREKKVAFMHVLRRFQYVQFPTDDEENEWLHIAVELMMTLRQRLSFYRTCKARALTEGRLQLHAEFCCYETMQLLDLGYAPEDIIPLLDKAEAILHRLQHQNSRSVCLSYATLNFCRGWALLRHLEVKGALQQLKACLAIREELLGDHLLTERALMGLGQAMHCAARTKTGYNNEDMLQAITYYDQSLGMCRRITGSTTQHVDAPTILVNMGSCLHEMSIFNLALECFERSLELERLLGIERTRGTCTTFKNIGAIYFSQRKFSDALHFALLSLEGRQTLLGIHPDTVRSLHFVGVIYTSCQKYENARFYLDRALEMEEELWRRGKRHSSDWRGLQEEILHLLFRQGEGEVVVSQYRQRFEEAEDENAREKMGERSIDRPAKRKRTRSLVHGGDLQRRRGGGGGGEGSSKEENGGEIKERKR